MQSCDMFFLISFSAGTSVTVVISVEFAWYLLTALVKTESCSQLNIEQGYVCEAELLDILDRVAFFAA